MEDSDFSCEWRRQLQMINLKHSGSLACLTSDVQVYHALVVAEVVVYCYRPHDVCQQGFLCFNSEWNKYGEF